MPNLVEFLLGSFGESLVGRGLANTGMVMEVYAGPSGTWTVAVTALNGLSCLIAVGEGWEAAKPKDHSA